MSAKQLIQDPAHRSWPGVREYPLNILRETILLGVIAVVALMAPIVGVLKSGWFVGYLLGIPLWNIVIPIGWFIRPAFFKSLRLTDKGIELLRRGKDVFNVPWSSIEGARVCYVGVGGVLRLYGEGLTRIIHRFWFFGSFRVSGAFLGSSPWFGCGCFPLSGALGSKTESFRRHFRPNSTSEWAFGQQDGLHCSRMPPVWV